MQIAKMFASLGFKVDTSGLTVFKAAINDARKELTKISIGARNSKNQLQSLRKEVDKVSKALHKIKGTAGSGKVSSAYVRMADSAAKLNVSLMAIVNNRKKITNAIGKINSSVFAGLDHWDRYRRSVVQTRRSLLNLNREISRLRANARVDVRIRNSGGNGGAGGGGGSGGGTAGGLLAGLGLRGFLSNIVPTLALTGIGGGVGYGGKMMVETNRDNTRMESMILMTSKTSAQYKDTIDYINKEGLRLGLSVSELGKSFAQISMSAEKLTQTEKKEMFTGFSEFMMSMGTSQDDQKGIFRAFNQMFSNNRILQEEINQLSDRGIPATLIYDAAMKEYGLDNVAQVKKLQEAGKLDPSRVLTAMSKSLQAKAHDSGAFDRMKESSIFKQNQFMAEMRKFSVETMSGGLDEKLGDLFGLLSLIVKEVRELSVVISATIGEVKAFSKGVEDMTGAGWGLQLILLLVFSRYNKITKGIGFATAAFKRHGQFLRSIAHVFTGVFGRALGSIALRMTVWGAAIYAVRKAYKFLFQEIEKRDAGDWNWFDEMSIRAEVFSLRLRKLVDEFLWFKDLLMTGAIMEASVEQVVEGVVDKTRSLLNPIPFIARGLSGVGEIVAKYNEYTGTTSAHNAAKAAKAATPNSIFPSQSVPYSESGKNLEFHNTTIINGIPQKTETKSFLLN